MAHIGVENWLTVQHLSELFDKVWGSRVTFRTPFSSISEISKDPHFYYFDENIFVFFDKVYVLSSLPSGSMFVRYAQLNQGDI